MVVALNRNNVCFICRYSSWNQKLSIQSRFFLASEADYENIWFFLQVVFITNRDEGYIPCVNCDEQKFNDIVHKNNLLSKYFCIDSALLVKLYYRFYRAYLLLFFKQVFIRKRLLSKVQICNDQLRRCIGKNGRKQGVTSWLVLFIFFFWNLFLILKGILRLWWKIRNERS